MFKRIALAAGLLAAATSNAFSAGQLPSGWVVGNNGASAGERSPTSVTAILDRALGSVRGSLIERGASGWGLVNPSSTSGLPWVSNGTGADPAYQMLGATGGGTNNAFFQVSGPASSVKTYTFPNANASIAALNAIETWTSAQSFTDGTLILLGSSSGSSTLKAPSTGGGTATLFPGSDTVAGLAATQTFTNKTVNCASNTCTVRLGSDVTGNLSVNNLNGGTGASSSSYWRGDGTWATPPGSGTVTSAGLTNTYGLSISGSPITTSGNISAGVSLTNLSNVLGSNVSLNNTANYFDGPSVAQGTTGTWFASGSVVLSDSSAGGTFLCKLWDGTTVIASGADNTTAATLVRTVTLSGALASPAANIRISCRDSTSTSGLINFNASGNSKDSSIYVHRIQ